jgi:hypothetical protein
LLLTSTLKGMTDMMQVMASEFRSATAAASVPPERRHMTQQEREASYRTETISVPAESHTKSSHSSRQRSPPPRQQTSESESEPESGECDEEDESDTNSPPARGREPAKRQVERQVPTPAADLHSQTQKRPHKKPAASHEQDDNIIDLQDQGGYDSEGREVTDVTPHTTATGTPGRTVVQTIQPQILPLDTPHRSVSPGAVSRVSDIESENRFMKLKKQRDNVFSQIAATIGFDRVNPEKAACPGLSEAMLGSSQALPNVGLPWNSAFPDHVALHNRIMDGSVARNGTPHLNPHVKAQPWKVGDSFKVGDLSKTTVFPQTYTPYPTVPLCSAEPPPLEVGPRSQPFETGTKQGSSTGRPVDISRGQVRLNETYLHAQQAMIMRSIGAFNSLDTLLHYLATEGDNLTPELFAEVVRHARFDIAAGTSYAMRASHNMHLLRRQAAIGTLQGARAQPPLTQADYQDLYRAPFKSESLFGGELASLHQVLVDKMQSRPLVVASPNSRPSVMDRLGPMPTDKAFKSPRGQPKKRKRPRRTSHSPQGTPAKQQTPAGVSSSDTGAEPTPPSPGRGRGRGRGQNKGRGRGRGSGQGADQ